MGCFPGSRGSLQINRRIEIYVAMLNPHTEDASHVLAQPPSRIQGVPFFCRLEWYKQVPSF
ncbi:hypothetical protein D3C77_454600 [compost metagenome]